MNTTSIRKTVSGLLFCGLVVTGFNAQAAQSDEVSLYLVRHGKTMLNTTDRVQGWSDAVLTPAGEKVVNHTAEGMKNIKFTAAYSSDSGRAVQTAHMILARAAVQPVPPLKTDWRLREFNFGSYEGDLNHTMWTDIATKQGKTLEEWMKTFSPSSFADAVAELDKGRVEEGVNWPAEDYATITKRLQEAVKDIVESTEKAGGGNVLIVSHGLSISSIVNVLDPAQPLPETGLKNASVTKITYKGGKYKVESLGDMSFNEAGKKAAAN